MIGHKSKVGFLVLAMAVVLISLSLLTAAPSGAASDQKKVLKFGSILPFNQKEGLEIQKWMKLFAKMYNEQGGWLIGGQRYQVEYTAYDGGFQDAAKARSAVERAVLQDGLKILVSNWGDPETQTTTITEPNKVLVLGTALTTRLSGRPTITTSDHPASTSPAASRISFRRITWQGARRATSS